MNNQNNRSIRLYLAFFLTLSTGIFMQNATAQNYVINPTTDGSFEGSHGWTIVNTTNVNKWIIGTDQKSAGSSGAYVSDNNSSNTITNPQETNSKIYIYKDVVVPLNATSITVSFKYKNAGTDIPAPRCLFERTSAFPSLPTDGNSSLIGGDFVTVLNNSSGWITYTNTDPFTTDRPATYSSAPLIPGTSYRIVFEWSAAYQTSFTQVAPFCTMPSSASISGNMSITPGSNETYSVVSTGGGNFLYTWNLTGGSTIVSGQGNSTIVVHYPNGYSSGKIGCTLTCPSPTLTNNGKTGGPLAIDEVSITYVAVPKITSFSPASAAVGSSVAISGEYFDATAANNVVYLGGVRCTVTGASATSLTVTVPPFATFNNFTVLNTATNLSATSADKFVPKNTSLAGIPYSGYASGQNGSFEPAITYTAAALPSSVDQKFALADIDGDGKIDIVSNYKTTGVPQVYRNTSTSGTIVAGSLTLSAPASISPSIAQSSSVLTADLNNDGKIDIAASNGTVDGGFANINSSTSGLVSLLNYSSILSSLGNYKVSSSFLPLDINLDGRVDILGISSGTPANAFFTRNGTTGTTYSSSTGNALASGSVNKILSDGNFYSGASGDMNADGKPDVILGGSAEIYALQNTTTQGAYSVRGFTFSEPLYKATAGGNCNAVKLADLDGDGKPDVIATNSSSANVSVFRNTSTAGGSITLNAIQNFASTLATGTYGLAVADMNGDGKPDLIFSNNVITVGGGGIAYLENTSSVGSISFAPSITIIIPGIAYSQIEIADIDGDNKPDIIAAGATATISIFRNRQTEAGVISADQAVCSGSIPAAMTSVLAATFASGTPNYLWQTATTMNGTWSTAAVTNTNAAYTPTATISSTTYFRRRAESSAAIGTYYYSSPVTVTVTPAPTITGSTAATGCGTTTVSLAATSGAGNTIQWFTASTGGTAIGTGSPWVTPTISANTTYYAGAVTANGCLSASRTAVLATINTIAPTMSGATAASRCDAGSVTLAVTASTSIGTTINWYTAATGGSPVGTGSAFVTPEISATTTYYVDAVNCIGTTASRTAVIATINITPTILSTVPNSGCQSTNVVLSAVASGGTLKWYDAASSGNVSSATVSNISTTTTRWVSAISAAGSCESPRVAIIGTMNTLPSAAVTSGNTLCALGTAIVTATPPTNGSITWYSALTGGTSLGSSVSYTSPTMAASASYYALATDANGCNATARTIATITYNGPTVGAISNLNAVTNSTSQSFSASGLAGQTSFIWQRSKDAGTNWEDISAGLDPNVTYSGFSGTTATTSSLTISVALPGMHLYQYRLKLTGATGACINYSNTATLYVADFFGTCQSATKLTLVNVNAGYYQLQTTWSHIIGYTVDYGTGESRPDLASNYNYSFGSMTDGNQQSGLIVGIGTGSTAMITNYLPNYLTTSTLINQVYLKGFVDKSYSYGSPDVDGPNWDGGSIQVSTDNTNWTTVVPYVSGTGTEASGSGYAPGAYYTFPAVYARYVRAIKSSEGGLSEFYVFPADMSTTPFVKNLPATPQNISTGATFSPSIIVTPATGQTVSTYQWSKSADNITFTDLANGGTISGATTANLTITSFAAGNIGYYKLTATQGNGCTITPVIQAVLVAPYYSSAAGAAGALQTASNWNTGASGSGGSAAADFAAGKFFILANAASTYTFGANWTVGGTLRMNGKVLTLGNYNATIGNILEASNTAYVKTNGTGKLISSTSTTANLFPVGNSTYNPVTIMNNTGTTDNFSVSVSDAVLASGSTGTAMTNVVNRTWTINKVTSGSTSAGYGVNLTFQWRPADISGTVTFPVLKAYASGWVEQTADQITRTDSTLTYTGYKGTLNNTMFMLSNSSPAITSFTPVSAGNGGSVVITGTGLNNASAVSFGGTAATSFAPNSGALNFDGTNDYVNIADANVFDLINNYSIECWIKPESFGSLKGIVSKYNSAGAISYALRQNSTTPFTGLNFDGLETANGLFIANRWYHIAVTKSYSTRKLFVNGVEVALTGTGTTITANTDPLVIGADLKNATYFDGSVDEVRIWNTTRTQLEVQNNMLAEISPAAAGLTAYYNFNSLISTSLTDLVATPKNGTLTNFALTGISSNWGDGFLPTTQITAVVAAGTTGSVSVTTPGGTATLAGFTFVAAPAITYFTPARANAGTTVTITGTNLSNAATVTFGGTAASSFTVVSSTQITAVVRTGTTGSVVVTTPGGTATKAGFVYGMPYASLNVLAAWSQTNTSTQSYPYAASVKAASVSAAGQNFSGLTKVNDAQNKWQNTNASASLDYTTAPYVSYSVTTTASTKFDRFVIPGLNASGTKIQLRWSVDGYAGSLGEFTPGTGASFSLSSVDLISTALQAAGTIEFRTYMYNGNSDAVAQAMGSSNASTDGTAPALYDGTYAVMIYGAARTTPTLGTMADIIKNLGDPAFFITPPTTNSTGVITYSFDNAAVATVSSSRVSIAGTGTATLTATLAATDNYNEATTTAQVSVKTAPVILFQNMHKTIGNAAFTINAVSTSAGAITYTSGTPATATISGNTVTLVAGGTTVITATQAADGIYNAATATAILTVGTTTNSNPTLVWVSGINKTMGNAGFAINASPYILSTNSGVTPSYYSGNASVATLSSNTATLVAPGISILTAVYLANSTYNAGNISTVLTVGTVGYADPTLSGFPAINKYVNDAAFTLSAPTSNSAGSFFYLSSNPAVAVVNGTTVNISGSGTCNIIAVQYADGSFNAGTISATLTVAQVFTYATPNIFTKATAITNLAPVLSPGTAPAYSVSPVLPRGLAISTTTGIISGTPTMVTPNATYTVTAVNTGGTATATLDIRVNDIVPATLSYTTPNIYAVGTGITTLTPTTTGGEITTYTVSPVLPDGLVINDQTGEISGTPTAAYPITTYVVTGSNSGGSRSANVVITVTDKAPLLLTYSTPNTLSKGNSISPITPSYTGGVITGYSVSPALPTGLSLSTTSGIITGTPTVVVSSFTTYTVTGTNTGGSINAPVQLLVNDAAPNGLSYTTPNVFTKGTAITQLSPTSTGGAVTSYSIDPDLPSGLSLNTTTGVISGTASVIQATTTYLVTATNFVGSASANVVITVNDILPSDLSYSSPNVYTIGTGITDLSPVASGGAVTSYSVSPTLPSGLSLDTTTGVISGTPAAMTSQATYVVTATNSGGSVTANVSITVNKASQSITFGATATKDYGNADFAPGATSATSGTNAITYTSSNSAVATIVSGQIHIVGVGTTNITASQAASANYSAASDVVQSLTANAISLTISGASAQNKPYDGINTAVITGTLSGVINSDDVTLSLSGTFASVNVATGIVVTSTSTLGGAKAGNYSLTQPTGLTANITILSQTITFGTLSAKIYGDADFAPGATSATSGINAITYVSSNTAVATIVNSQIHIVDAGTTNITASQTGNSIYSSATDVTQSLTVYLAPTITSFSPTTAATGATVTITGTNLNGITAVSFGGTAAASFNVASATSVTAVVASGTSGSVSVTTPGGTVTLAGFTYSQSKTWTGTTNTDWNTTTNWSPIGVPLSTDIITIPSTTNNPVVNDLTIASGGSITIAPLATLTITGTLTNSNTGGIVIQSDASGTGSLIAAASSGSGTTIAQRYMTAGSWHLVASPVVQTVSSFLTANSAIPTNVSARGMMDYNPTTNQWNDFFTDGTGNGNIGAGKGFGLRVGASAVAVTATGALQAGSISVAASSGYWDCIGNPYSSAFRISTGSSATDNFMDVNATSFEQNYGAIYVWNKDDSFNGQYGNYTVVSNVPAAGFEVLQQGQAFMVKRVATGGADFSFTPAMQLHSTTLALKSTANVWPTIKLIASANSQGASTIIAFNDGMTKGLDRTYDAGLLRGGSDVQLYTKLVEAGDNTIPFAIQALPDNNFSSMIIPVGVESKIGGEVLFSAQTTNLPSACKVILEDKLTKTFTDLSANVYKAAILPNSTIADRFQLHTSIATIGAIGQSILSGKLNAYAIGNTEIRVVGEVSGKAVATLYDVLGRAVAIHKLSEGTLNVIPLSNIKSGVYILSVEDKGITNYKLRIVN